MSETSKPASGSNSSGVIVVVIGLMIAASVFLVALALRTNERGAEKAARETIEKVAEKKSPSAGPGLLKATPKAIETWIRDEMKKTDSKVALVNVWATWCEPCRQEMPELVKVSKNSRVFLVSADNESDELLIRDFLSSAGVHFESALIEGDQQVFIDAWKNKSAKDATKQWSMTLPVTFVVNNNADVLSFHVGATTASGFEKMMKSALDTARD